MTPSLRTSLLSAAKPTHRPVVIAALDEFDRWLAFVNFAGVGQHYQERIRSLGGLGRALMKYEVLS